MKPRYKVIRNNKHLYAVKKVSNKGLKIWTIN